MSEATNIGRDKYAGTTNKHCKHQIPEATVQLSEACIKWKKLQTSKASNVRHYNRMIKCQTLQLEASNVRLYNWKHQMSDSTIGSIKCQTLLYVQSEASNVRLYNRKHQFCPDYSQFCPDYSQFCPDYPRDRIPPSLASTKPKLSTVYTVG